MLDCVELIGNIIAVHPVAVGEVSFPMPFNVRVASINASAVSYDGKALTVDAVKSIRGLIIDDSLYNEREDNIEIEPGVSVKESSKTTIAGPYYTTKISMESYEELHSIRQFVFDLESKPAFDVFIVDSEDRVYLLRGVEPACKIDFSASLPISKKCGIDIELQTVSGLQRVIF